MTSEDDVFTSDKDTKEENDEEHDEVGHLIRNRQEQLWKTLTRKRKGKPTGTLSQNFVKNFK